MRRRTVVGILATMAMMLPMAGHSVAEAVDPAKSHVFWLQGVSTLQNQTQYVYASSGETDEVGIVKPSTLPPTSNGVGCTLGRNTNPALPKRACSGTLTHQTLPGNQGCTEVGNPLAECSFSGGYTWYYGFCGQTYGGAENIQFRIGNQLWEIDRMGFPRARGTWEFNGKMKRLDRTGSARIRMYLLSVPNNPDEAAGCDLTNNISSIYFQGVAIVTPDPLPRAIAAKPGWHWCANEC